MAILFILAAAISLGGCASAKVSNETKSTPVAVTPPDKIYISTFDLSTTTITSDPGTLTGRPRLIRLRQNDPTETLRKLADQLTDDLAADLNDADLPAQRLSDDATQPTTGWLVTGQFLELQQGNNAQRAVIGFGAGNSDAQLYVAITDLAHPQDKSLINFNTDSTGNQTPGGGIGVVVAHSPWGMVVKFALGRNASEKDIRRTAQAISNEIAKFAGKKTDAP
jgi:hypothetical protein